MAAVDEPLADLGGDEPLALEDADGVAAETDEHGSDAAVFGDLLEQRPDADDFLVLGRVSRAGTAAGR